MYRLAWNLFTIADYNHEHHQTFHTTASQQTWLLWLALCESQPMCGIIMYTYMVDYDGVAVWL